MMLPIHLRKQPVTLAGDICEVCQQPVNGARGLVSHWRRNHREDYDETLRLLVEWTDEDGGEHFDSRVEVLMDVRGTTRSSVLALLRRARGSPVGASEEDDDPCLWRCDFPRPHRLPTMRPGLTVACCDLCKLCDDGIISPHELEQKVAEHMGISLETIRAA